MRSPAPSTGSRRKSEVVVIEAKAFIAAFAVQVLAMSVVIPAWTASNPKNQQAIQVFLDVQH